MNNSTAKLNRAKNILTHFSKDYKDFISTNYKLIKEVDEATDKFNVRLRIKQQLPGDWGSIIGDIIHNTRSSLDLLITDLLLSNGMISTNKSAFPIFETEKDFLDKGKAKAEGIHADAWELIQETKPYKEGNVKLWQLHQIDIIDKHRIIIPVVSENKAVVIDFGAQMKQIFGDKVSDIPSMSIGIRPADRVVSDGMILFSADKTHIDPKFEFELVFGKNDILVGESISDCLNGFINLTDSIINKFESLISN